MKKFLLLIAGSFMGSLLFAQTNWYEIPTGTNSRLNAIDFPTNSVGYIVGEDTTLLKSTDGGQTWQTLPLTGISTSPWVDLNFSDIDFVDENNGFLVAGYNGIFATTDGGQSWTAVGGQTSNMCFPECVYPYSSTDFFAGGAGCFQGAIIDRYQNGTWTTGTLSTTFWDSQQTVVEMSFSGNTRGLAATRSEFMLRTVDGGANWDTISTNINGVLTSVVMVNDTVCFAGYDENGAGFGILKSTDGGLTWAQDINSATFFYPAYLSVHASDNGDIYSGGVPSFGTGGLMFESIDGLNWDYQTLDQPINNITSYGSDITFAVGDSGYLIVNTPLAELGVSSKDDINISVHPNPFQDEIHIENPTSQTLKAQLLDAYGRIMQNMEIAPGNTSLKTEDLLSGIYFIQWKMETDVKLTRLVKI